MRVSAYMVVLWQLALLAVLIALWCGLAALLHVSRGDLEGYLLDAFKQSSRADAFEFINRAADVFWLVHSCLLLVGIAAVYFRRSDVLIVLLIGPVIALVINMLAEDWSDPSWYMIVMVSTIGWLIGTIVGVAYWAVKQKEHVTPAPSGAR